MRYIYDTYGWLDGTISGDAYHPRSTDAVPPSAPAGQKPNWTGTVWLLLDFIEPAPLVPVQPPRSWSVGEFLTLLTTQEYKAALTLSETDDEAAHFWAVLMGTIAIKEDHPLLKGGLLYFKYCGVTTRSPEDILDGKTTPTE